MGSQVLNVSFLSLYICILSVFGEYIRFVLAGRVGDKCSKCVVFAMHTILLGALSGRMFVHYFYVETE